MKISDKIYAFILFTQFSETYHLVSLGFHVSTKVLSVSTLLINLVYILANLKIFTDFFKNKLYISWFFLLLVFPSLCMVINMVLGFLSLTDLSYWFFFNLLFVTLFICSCIFAFKVSKKALIKLTACCILSTLIGFVLNYTFFGLFQQMGDLANIDRAYVSSGKVQQRGFSFFSEANRAGFSIICFFILIVGIDLFKRFWVYMVITLLLIAMIFITGSRTSLLIAFVLISLYFTKAIANFLHKKNKVDYQSTVNIIGLTVMTGGFLIVVLLFFVSGILKQNGMNILGSRMDFLNISSSNEFQDQSLDNRVSMIGVYWDYIEQNPIFGYGPEWLQTKVTSGFFYSSQNAFVTYAIYYGIPFTLFYLYILATTFFYKSKSAFKNYPYNLLRVFTLFVLLLGFSVPNLYWNRSVIITLGVIIGLAVKNLKELHSQKMNDFYFVHN